jgi:hypothetical protein
MNSIIYFNDEINSNFTYSNKDPFSPQAQPLKDAYYDLPMAYTLSPEELSGKAHLPNEQTIGTSLVVSSIFFGILALMFPQASVAFAIYTGLSVSSAVAGVVLLASIEKSVEIPLAQEFSDIS